MAKLRLNIRKSGDLILSLPLGFTTTGRPAKLVVTPLATSAEAMKNALAQAFAREPDVDVSEQDMASELDRSEKWLQ